MEVNKASSSFDMYINEDVFKDDYIDYEELKKAADQVHQYFNREVTIKLSKGYAIVFEPVDERSSALVSNVLTKDVHNLQPFIAMLRFRRIKIVSAWKSKRKEKIARVIDLHVRCIQDDNDKDGFTSYDPEFIPDVLAALKRYILLLHDKSDFSSLKMKKLSEEEMKNIYQLYQEIYFILDLLYGID